MKIAIYSLAAAALAVSSISLAQGSGSSAQGGTVTVTVSGVVANGGPVLVALQDNATFAQAAATYSTTVTPTGRTVTATIRGVAPGRYAAAVVQDINKDGTLTLGETGPTEPYGFSGRAQKGAPTFQPASFQVNSRGGSARVALKAR